MSDSGDDKSNTPRTDIIAGLWGGGDATIRRQLRRMEDHARQLENELSLAERRLATSEKCRNNLAASIPSSTAFVPEGERKSLAGQAIEMAISALRDIQRRAPGTRTFFDYEAFIERELVPAMAMADKDRQGCIGLMGLLAKEKLKVEELSKPVSATASSSLLALLRDCRQMIVPYAIPLSPVEKITADVAKRLDAAIQALSAMPALSTPGTTPDHNVIRAAIFEKLDGDKPWLFWDEDHDLANAQRVDFANGVVAWIERRTPAESHREQFDISNVGQKP